ncbi:MAG: MFS transporter, partial [Acidimicrobiales bacterium]
RAYGFVSVGWAVGAILGILLGGVIVTYVDWRWIFWINVPTGIMAIVLALRVLQDEGKRVRERVDFPGMLLFGGGIFGILWAMTELSTASFTSEVAAFLIGGVVLLAVFVVVERATETPMLDLSLFRIPTVSPTMLASLFQGMANFAVLFLCIMYLQGVRDLSPLHASLLLVPGYLVVGVSGPIAGRLTDKLGPVWPATAGLAIEVVALLMFASLDLHTSVWLVVWASIVNGVGGGLFFPANTTAVMRAAPRQLFGVASGTLRTSSNVGMVFSFAVAILVAGRAIPHKVAFEIFVGTTHLTHGVAASFTSGLHAAFYAAIGIMAVAAVLSATRVLHVRRDRVSRVEVLAGE